MENSSPALFQTATSASSGNAPGPWRRQDRREQSQYVEGRKAGKAAPLWFLSPEQQRSPRPGPSGTLRGESNPESTPWSHTYPTPTSPISKATRHSRERPRNPSQEQS